MKRTRVITAAMACALLGWFLPSLWLAAALPRKASRIAPHLEAVPSLQSFTTKVRAAGSAMAQFQAIAAGAGNHAHSLIDAAGILSGFSCEEAEELAIQLAGGELALHVSDGAAFIRSLKGLSGRVRVSAVATWADRDPDAALRALFTPEGLKLVSGLDDAVLRRLAEHDPDKALQLLRAEPAGTANGWSALIAVLAKKDSALALSTLESAPVSVRRTGMHYLVSGLAEKDPQAALEWTKTLNPGLRSLVSLSTIYSQWAGHDPAAAIAAWEETDKEALNQNSWLVRKWAEKDPEGALEWSVKQENFSSIYHVIDALFEKNPRRVPAILDEVKDSQRMDMLNRIAGTWGYKDFPAALAWARTLTKPGEKDAAISNLVSSAIQLPEPERRAFISEAGAESAAGFRVLWSLDRGEAMRNFETMTPQRQLEVWEQVTDSFLMEGSPAALAGMMDILRKNDPVNATVAGTDLLPRMVSTWARSDPAAAAAWVNKSPEGDTLALLADKLVSSWSRNDLDAAAAWTQTLPAGPAKDNALSQLAGAASSAGDPSASLKWSASIKDESMRTESLKLNFATWFQADPSAARAAANALSIDPAEKARILNILPK